MIIKMKKYSFLIFSKEQEDFLQKLKSLGVVHIRRNNDVSDMDNIKALLKKKKEVYSILNDARNIVKEFNNEDESIPQTKYSDVKDGAEFVEVYKQLQKRISYLHQQQLSNNEAIQKLYPWGEYNPKTREKLLNNGQLHLQFWTIPTPAYRAEWEEIYGALVIQEIRRITHFITISRTELSPKDLPESTSIEHPTRSISELKAENKRISEQMREHNRELISLANNSDALEAYLNFLEEKYRMTEARLQGTSLYDDKLLILEGWTPLDIASKLESALDNEGYAYAELEIKEGEEVPIKLKNNWFNRVFEPIIRIFSLPNYFELDPTPLIAPFFMLFFALCFGDGGYGLIILLLATYFKYKVDPSKKEFTTLFQILGGATMIVSFFTGTFFGIQYIEIPFLQPFKSFFLNQDNVMVLALVLGLVQIVFAKFVSSFKIQKQKGLKHSLSQFAWSFLILFGILFFGLPKLNIELPEWSKYLAYVLFGLCLIPIFFYNSPKKNILVNFGSGIWTAYNTASSILGDSLSYIRLFAIGLAGAILGGVFNTLAIDLTAGLPVYIRWLPMILILIVGHSINFGLCLIGAFVHPMRLIFVEYFKNSEYEGGGLEYKPLQEIGHQSQERIM